MATTRIDVWTWIWSTRHRGLGRKWPANFITGKAQLVSFDRSNNTGAIDVEMDVSFLEEISSFKMLGMILFSKLDWGSYIVSIVKTVSKEIGALICSMKFLSPEVALHLYKSTIQSCMKYCCHIWAGAPICYLELLDKLQEKDIQGCYSFTCCLSWTLSSSLHFSQLKSFL